MELENGEKEETRVGVDMYFPFTVAPPLILPQNRRKRRRKRKVKKKGARKIRRGGWGWTSLVSPHSSLSPQSIKREKEKRGEGKILGREEKVRRKKKQAVG